MRDSDLGDNVYAHGRAAWRRLKSNKNWNWRDWIIVGDSMMKARAEAFEEASTNKAVGGRYNQAFGRILRHERLDGIDSATRNHLFQVMDNLPAIEAWRQPLAQNLKERLNHPLSVLRRWKASQAVPKQRKSARQDEHNVPRGATRGAAGGAAERPAGRVPAVTHGNLAARLRRSERSIELG